jgi:hypothetical protein
MTNIHAMHNNIPVSPFMGLKWITYNIIIIMVNLLHACIPTDKDFTIIINCKSSSCYLWPDFGMLMVHSSL